MRQPKATLTLAQRGSSFMDMKTAIALVVLVLLTLTAFPLRAECDAPEFTVTKDGIGPIVMSTCVELIGNSAIFSGSARNDSGQAIAHAEWCVKAASQGSSGCAFSLWTTGVWQPGEAQEWTVTGPAVRGLPAHTVMLSKATLTSAGCLIVKHKGTIARRIIWHTLIWVPIAPGAKYDLVDSLNIVGAKIEYKGKELQRLQSTGVRVIVLETSARLEDVEAARHACSASE
jgi:hypothetical protein